ncbi:MAG: prolyl oligopeptidase family serine peptidase, partial [Planctomycetota bacterium]
MELVPEAPEGLRRVIRFAVAFVLISLPALAEPWPVRLGERRGVLHEYAQPIAGWFGRTVMSRDTGNVFDDPQAVAALLEQAGISADDLRFEQRSAHIVGVRGPRDGEQSDGFRYAVFASAQPLDDGSARLHRTWFRFRSTDQSKGLAVVMPGMLGTPYQFVDVLESALLADGWAVLRMLVPPSRSTERLEVQIDIDAPNSSVAALAAELDERSAECAFAVDAGVSWVHKQLPSLDRKPIVVIGMSGTGMMLPAVLVGNPDVFDAAVVIGSGANAFRILRETSYVDMLDAVRVSWEPRKPSSTELDALDELYLGYASLDAARLAPTIKDTPMLLIHGSSDRAVPAETGDLLWEKLERPERWTTPVGHELLFVRTLLRVPRLVDWLNE